MMHFIYSRELSIWYKDYFRTYIDSWILLLLSMYFYFTLHYSHNFSLSKLLYIFPWKKIAKLCDHFLSQHSYFNIHWKQVSMLWKDIWHIRYAMKRHIAHKLSEKTFSVCDLTCVCRNSWCMLEWYHGLCASTNFRKKERKNKKFSNYNQHLNQLHHIMFCITHLCNEQYGQCMLWLKFCRFFASRLAEDGQLLMSNKSLQVGRL